MTRRAWIAVTLLGVASCDVERAAPATVGVAQPPAGTTGPVCTSDLGSACVDDPDCGSTERCLDPDGTGCTICTEGSIAAS
jgi:hypothetical protein